jgi:hypothetical protein|uniref:NADH:ubiquinone oxidoreductase intermediate-associated protein 30 domain-containing protein n=1 Tax=Phaeodactylum tricornutum TaxID=2850 RepID=A0A8J9X6I5_PHATR
MKFGFLTRQGGGWMRRYLRVRKDILLAQWTTPDRYPCAPISLFDFSNHDDYLDAIKVHEKDQDGWRISDDRVIGGFSEASAFMVRTNNDLATIASGETPNPVLDAQQFYDEQDVNKNESTSKNKKPLTSFLRWQGTIDTEIGLQSDAQRSGFAALRSPEFFYGGANLCGLYSALELLCRTDGRSYTINLKVASSIPDDIYQGTVEIPASSDTFSSIVLPFSEFGLTARGRDREIHRELDDDVSLESIGVAIMDGRNGDFRFDLAKIRAVNIVDGTPHHKIVSDRDTN